MILSLKDDHKSKSYNHGNSSNPENKNIRRVGSITELFALKDDKTCSNGSSGEKKQSSTLSSASREIHYEHQSNNLRDQAVADLNNSSLMLSQHHNRHNPNTHFNNQSQPQEKRTIMNKQKIDESEIEWLMSFGYNREQALSVYLKKLTSTSSDEPTNNHNQFNGSTNNHRVSHAVSTSPTQQVHKQRDSYITSNGSVVSTSNQQYQYRHEKTSHSSESHSNYDASHAPRLSPINRQQPTVDEMLANDNYDGIEIVRPKSITLVTLFLYTHVCELFYVFFYFFVGYFTVQVN